MNKNSTSKDDKRCIKAIKCVWMGNQTETQKEKKGWVRVDSPEKKRKKAKRYQEVVLVSVSDPITPPDV